MRKLEKWLVEMDRGKGALLEYKDALVQHFDGCLVQIAAVWLPSSDTEEFRFSIQCYKKKTRTLLILAFYTSLKAVIRRTRGFLSWFPDKTNHES